MPTITQLRVIPRTGKLFATPHGTLEQTTTGSNNPSPYLLKSGDRMTGTLMLAGDPSRPLEAATKQYVDFAMTGGSGNYLPLEGGTMTGPLLLSSEPGYAMEAATKSYVDGKLVTATKYLPISAGPNAALTGELYLPVAPPTQPSIATNKKYVDDADSVLQAQVDLLASNLLFSGSIDVVADVGSYTAASGIPAGPLPAASPDNLGFYVIVTTAGTPPPGNIPAGSYNVGDWLVSDNAEWILVPVGQAAVIASMVAITPEIGALGANVQTGLMWLDENHLPLAGGQMTGPLLLADAPVQVNEAATKQYADWLINPPYVVSGQAESVTIKAATSRGSTATDIGGVLQLNGGDGGIGGAVNIFAGASRAPGQMGGSAYLYAGRGDPGGQIQLIAGPGIEGDGGDLFLTAGSSAGVGSSGGTVQVRGGQGYGGVGGPIYLTGGYGASTFDGGTVIIEGGTSVDAKGGDVGIIGGSGGTVGGGHVSIVAGDGAIPGNLTLSAGTDASGLLGAIRVLNLPTTVPTDPDALWNNLGVLNIGTGGIPGGGGGAYLPLGGGTLTGPLILQADPTDELGAATKHYVDHVDNMKLNVFGDTMTGPLMLSADPVQALEAVTKQYVDAQGSGGISSDAPSDGTSYGRKNALWERVLPLTGGLLTGPLLLQANPTDPVGATTKSYVDTADLLKLNLTGGIMTGSLVLPSDPVNSSEAATKGYVDRMVGGGLPDAPSDGSFYGRQNTAWVPGLPLTGGTLTGALTVANKILIDSVLPARLMLRSDSTLNQSSSIGFHSTVNNNGLGFVFINGSSYPYIVFKKLDAAGATLGSDIITFAEGFIDVKPMLILRTEPTQPSHATTKNYVDTADNMRVRVYGDTMTGPLVLALDPTRDMEAATKQYVDNVAGGGGAIPDDAPLDGTSYGRKDGAWDNVLSLAGGTMGGDLILNADPTTDFGAATKYYVDNIAMIDGGVF